MQNALDSRLREVVHQSVAILGHVVQSELGVAGYRRIEEIRDRMSQIRRVSSGKTYQVLKEVRQKLKRLTPKERLSFARSYTLMLELMNACENAYRTHQIRGRPFPPPAGRPDSIIYVLTAHPTESRSPQNIAIFQIILHHLTEILARPRVVFREEDKERLTHSLELAWRGTIVRGKKPRVQDEAEHIYSLLLREEAMAPLLRASRELAPVYLRSWVGGDKDGHPGVNEKVFLESLKLSRKQLVALCLTRFRKAQASLKLIPATTLETMLNAGVKELRSIKKLQKNDGLRIQKFRKKIGQINAEYQRGLHSLHPALQEIKQILHIFPALVVPLEFREASDVLVSSPTGRGLAIDRMLKKLADLAGEADPRWYVRGFIVSMTEEIHHLQLAAGLVQKHMGRLRIPIVPLFENEKALVSSRKIISGVLADPVLRRAVTRDWNNQLEIMLGYSDSSKESGVLESRLMVAEAMHTLDQLCRKQKVTPIFFQGSGGSTDRGGGTIPEQTAWWSTSALRNYKVTIQGEMVERALANTDITWGQLERIAHSAGRWKEVSPKPLRHSPAVKAFAGQVAKVYRSQVHDPQFLKVIEYGTPYKFLGQMKFGSRPSKRTQTVSVAGLRAIPWILCWTQTRTLFPTWWGVGTAWAQTSSADRARLRRAYGNDALFSTFVRALGFTLSKVELGVFRIYLENSGLPSDLVQATCIHFEKEYQKALACAHFLLGSRELIPWRPWLAQSIRLRAPMIHPLNMLQSLAMQDDDLELLRLTVAGIASGMMSTG